MRKFAWAFVVCVVIIAATGVSAKTPDGVTPSQETICDLEEGAAYGLCTAYCEAMDCTDPNQRASNQGCDSVRENYEKHTGRIIPCAVQCPCFSLQIFQDIINGQAMVDRCTESENMLFVVLAPGEPGAPFAVIDSVTASCSANNQAPFVGIDPMQTLACRVRLRQILKAQGIICTSPE